MEIESIKQRLTDIVREYANNYRAEIDCELLAENIVKKLPITMVNCRKCGNQDIVTERQCYKCNHFWTEG